MKKSLIIIMVVAVIAVLVLIFGFSQKSESPAPAQQPQTTQGTNTQQNTENQQPQDNQDEAPATVTIVYTDEGFAESLYLVASGGTVTVQNDSAQVLEFSSDNHPSHTKNQELNMVAIQPGKTGQFTVQKTGVWGFHNHLLAAHTGVLTVR